jgi:hypothetical protein
MAAGALVGPEMVLRGVLLGLILNLPVSLTYLAIKGRLGNLVRFWVKRDRSETTRMVFGPVISVGMLLARVQPWPNLLGDP